MNKLLRTFLAVLLAAGITAPTFAADPPVIPAEVPPPTPPKSDAKKKPATSKSAASKSAAAKTAAAKKTDETVKLSSPEPAVVSQKNVNVRGQARINSEVVSHLNKGDKITVLEEITTKQKPNEPDKWYKISLPPSTSVWVFAGYVDADKKVKSNRLNLRSGPGENFSVIGTIEKGTAVNVVETKGEWYKIEAPAGAYAFVAAHLVTREPVTLAANTAKPPPPPPDIPVVPQPPVAVAQPVVNEPPPTVIATQPAPPLVPVVRPEPPGPPPEEPLAKRVVSREGIIKSSVSIQAPSHYVLRGLDNNKTINYLYSPPTNDFVKNYWGKKVFVTGEEVLDERWPNTPVIEVETIHEIAEPEAPK
jgi:uncharacterized protein YgiM (DUF1202 family)